MNAPPLLTYEPASRSGGTVMFRGNPVAVFHRLELRRLLLGSDGRDLFEAKPGMPLYWRQYAGHEDPERSARHRGEIRLVGQSRTRLHLAVRSTNRSGSLCSEYRIAFLARDPGGLIRLQVTARLSIPSGRSWQVTPNPNHGETTFCTLWPRDVFPRLASVPKRFQSCLLVPASGTPLRIPHHHLESPDKHNLGMRTGDRFAWCLESWNPTLGILGGDGIEAGLCAYMWDAHFGLRLCPDNDPVDLQGPFERTVSFRLESVPRRTAARWLAASRAQPLGPEGDVPPCQDGLQHFERSFREACTTDPMVWPWQTRIIRGLPGQVTFDRDTTLGCGDNCSLRIDHAATATSRWEATTLGPAYGQPAFRPGERLRLTAMVRTAGCTGKAWISLRWHRTGRGSVFCVDDYEQLESPRLQRSRVNWRRLEIISPPIEPAADRVHLGLQFAGRGSVWFDDVAFNRLPAGEATR